MPLEGFEPTPQHRALFQDLALDLLRHLDPETFMVTASGGGIAIYFRTNKQATHPWERKMWEENQPLPADWIGWLSRTLPPPTTFNENNLPTGGRSLSTFVPEPHRRKGRAGASMRRQSYSRKSESN